MSNNNDKRILALREKIAEKKKELGKVKRFNPITNCSLELDGSRYNLNVINMKQATTLLIKLNMYKRSAEDLDLFTELIISGYSVEDWMTDVKQVLDILHKKEEEKKLREMESKLEQLLSEEKKVALELDDIDAFLKGDK